MQLEVSPLADLQRWSAVNGCAPARAWLGIQANLGLANGTVTAYARSLEAKANLERMVVEIPLTDDERAAVEDRQAAVDRLLDRLADVPTPAGPTPRQLGRRLPVLQERPLDSGYIP